MLYEVDIDFRIPGLPHSVVKRNAKSAFCFGFKASSIALTRISWKKVKPTEAPFNVHWTFSQFKIMLLRRDDLMATDMGKLQKKRNYHIAHNLRKRCIKRRFTWIHVRFLNDPEFRASQLEHDRIEGLFPDGRACAKKFSHHMTQAEYFRSRIGGSLSIILEDPDYWKIVLTSTMRWPQQTVYTKNLENDNSGQCHSGSINTGTNHRVLPPVGGNGAILGGAHNNSKKVHK